MDEITTEIVGELMVAVLLLLGVLLLLAGLLIGGINVLTTEIGERLTACAALFAACSWTGKTAHRWVKTSRVRRAARTELAEELTQLLRGNDTEYVVEAAEKLGEARDTSAVPDLIFELERCLESQRPGWRERSEALANALARIGDPRALPLLYRLENVRGIGLIPAIRNAIAEIEPRANLLRAGNAHGDSPDTLLHPVRNVPDESPQVLVRAAEPN
jgi:hypothetical protein